MDGSDSQSTSHATDAGDYCAIYVLSNARGVHSVRQRRLQLWSVLADEPHRLRRDGSGLLATILQMMIMHSGLELP